MSRYINVLTKMFEAVEPEFRASTIVRYRLEADRQFEMWKKLLEGPEPRGRPYVSSYPPEYVRPAKDAVWSSYWEAKQKMTWEVNYEKAEQDANRAVTQAKEHFIAKQAKKLDNATESRKGKTAKMEGVLTYNVMIEGHITVKFSGGDNFTLVLSMIVNHRYTTGYKSFYQFPARFTKITKGKDTHATKSEAWMKENF